MRVFDGDPREHAYKLIATDARDHIVGTQACSQGVRHSDQERVSSSVACGVVGSFKPVHINVCSHELAAEALRSIDLAPDGGQASASATCSCQFIGPRILTVLGCLGAIFGRYLAVVDGLSTIFGRHLAVVDCPHAAVRSLSAPRGSQDTFVCRALTVVRRAIPCRAVEIANRVVTGFSFLITQPGRNVTVLCSKPGLPTANRRQLVGPGILAILRGVSPVFGRHLAIVYSSYAAIRGLSSP